MRDWTYHILLDDGSPIDSYNPPNDPVPANYEILWINVAPNTAGTSAVITVGTPVSVPGSYGGSIAGSGSFNDPDFVINTTSFPYTVNGMTPGAMYTLRLRAYSGTGQSGTYGEYKYYSFVMPKPASVGSAAGTYSSTYNPLIGDRYVPSGTKIDLGNTSEDDSGTSGSGIVYDPTKATGSSVAIKENREISRSIFKVTNKTNDRVKYSVVTKDLGLATSYDYYMFGTGMFFDSVNKAPLSAGGIGFFVNSGATTGYFVEIQTDASYRDTKDKAVKILKVVNGNKKVLTDSQDSDSNKLYGGVLNSVQHKVDVKVKIDDENSITIIDVYINNFRITAVDDWSTSSSANPIDKKISPTSKFAMFSLLYQTNFDYIYAMPLTEQQYKTGILENIYNGQYGNTVLDFAYGNKIINNLGDISAQNAKIEEFGTVARELRKVKVNFAQPGAFPLYPSVGVNKYAKVIGSRFTNHGAEMYVANNAGTFIPLQAGANTFLVVGNYVSINGQHEYTENSINEYTTPEPATFESVWIQTEADAKGLYSWVKNQWSKQQQSINMEVFGNPVVEVGDIITVNYPDNNLDGTKKFVVTNVNNSFGEGLSTTITARSIYS